MPKQEIPPRRFTMTPDHERMLANFMHGTIPILKETPTDSAIEVSEKINPETGVSENRDYAIDIEEWIDLIGQQWRIATTLPYLIEILLKYHLILQTAGETIDTGYYELEHRKDGHDLYRLYRKTTTDFKKKLQVTYNQHISEVKEPGDTDIETLLRKYRKLYNRFRYDFFSKMDANNKIVSQGDFDYNMPSLISLVKSLYDLSNLENLCGITGSLIEEVDYKKLRMPLY